MIGREARRFIMGRFIDALDGRRQRILAWNLLARCGVTRLQFEREGLVWNLRPKDDIGWILFVDGGYHPEEMRALSGWIKARGLLVGRRNVIVDAGANIGTTSVPLARALDCRVIAIEPVEENLRTLRENVVSNRLEDRVTLVRKAIADRPGVVRMCLTRGASGGCFVARGAEREFEPSGIDGFEDVESGPLAEIVAGAGVAPSEVALVWADVQGCEADVIETGAPFWKAGAPLWAEVEPVSLRRQGTFDAFSGIAARHFRAFIDSDTLRARGAAAEPVPISALPDRIEAIGRNVNTDILFLP